MTRHSAKVAASTTRLNVKAASLATMNTSIVAAIAAEPTRFNLVDKSIDVEDKLEKSRQELLDLADSDVSFVMTMEESTIHKNAFWSYQDDEQKLIVNRGEVYVLLLDQCTQMLKDALKEDDNWPVISEKFNAIALFGLIEKCVLKQTSNKYPYLILQEEWRSLLLCKHESDHSMHIYY
jgi:alkyl sulfatase BDS1-like metallo-beta-lactamase superfamily hydrolase